MGTHAGRERGRARRRAAFTLLELVVSFSALLIVLLGFSRMIVSSRMASSTTHEATLAKEAARSMLEVLQDTTFEELFVRYNVNPADDPGGNGTAAGAGFAVRGLEASQGDADGLPGQILFPEQGGALREDLGLTHLFGAVADLDGDGNTDALDHAGDYRVLPVVVRVEWAGSGAAGRVEFRSVIGSF